MDALFSELLHMYIFKVYKFNIYVHALFASYAAWFLQTKYIGEFDLYFKAR